MNLNKLIGSKNKKPQDWGGDQWKKEVNNKLNSLSLYPVSEESVGYFFMYGCVILRRGPTRTNTEFKNYEVPLRFVVGTNFGGTDSSNMTYIDFIHTQKTIDQPPSNAGQPVIQPTADPQNKNELKPDIEEKFKKLKKMFEEGLITQDDYNKKKEELLNQL